MKSNRAVSWVILVLTLIVFLLLLSIRFINNNKEFSATEPQSAAVYLPLISKGYSKLLVGVEKEFISHAVDPYYDGDFLAFSVHAEWFLDSGFVYVDGKDIPGAKVLLKLKGAYPAWIEPSCKPIPVAHWQDWLDSFAFYIIDHIGPNRIIYVEIMNEPDVADPGLGLYLGCWGETYQEGVYYAQFVNYVAAELKARYPEIKVLGGAFLDVRRDFAAGAIATFSGIDAVSFHVYEWCNGDPLLMDFIELLESMTSYPLGLSETSVIYDLPSFICDQAQVEYYEQLTALVKEGRLLFFVWYTLGCRSHPWRNSDMILCDPLYFKPVYTVYLAR